MSILASNLQFNGYEAVGLIAERSATTPSGITDGQIFYNTALNKFMFRENGVLSTLGLSGTVPLSQLEDNDTQAGIPLLSGGAAGDPSYSAIDLASTVALTGSLPVSRIEVGTGAEAGKALVANNGSAPTYQAIDLNGVGINGRLPLTKFTQSGTAGQPLLSNGNAADAAYGALDLSSSSNVTNRLALANLANGGTVGQPLVAGGTDPVYGALDLTNSNAISGRLPLTNLADGTAGKAIVGTGTGTDPVYGALNLAGTGTVTGRLPLSNFADGTSGMPLLGAGTGSDPVYGALDLAGSGVTGTLDASHFGALTGDVTSAGGTYSTTVASVGGKSAAAIAAAVDASHAQNTDLGTNSATFQLGNGTTRNGAQIKNAAGGSEIQVRNSADTDFANLRVKDLIVEGTQTIINSATVSSADSSIELNGEIGTAAANSNGGIEVRRLAAGVAGAGTIDTTNGSDAISGTGTNFTNADVGKGILTAGGQARRIVEVTSTTSARVDVVFGVTETAATYDLASPDNASLEFNISTSRWQANFGAVGSTQPAAVVALKFAENNGAGTSHTLTHNLGTKDVVVSITHITSGEQYMADVSVGLNSVTVNFGSSYPADTFRITVIG
jgi:hypothetical protein